METVMPHFPDKQIGIRHQHGFSLIESLVSALILGIALFGLAGFHAAALKDGSLVKARSAAASLAQEKLDDLRSFIFLKDDTAIDEDGDGNLTNDCDAGKFCFSEIAASDTSDVNLGGGREDADGNLLLPSGTVYLDPPLNTKTYIDNYSRAWTVTCATETAGSALSFIDPSDPSDPCTGATAKLATVTISWKDSKGEDQLVRLQSVIYAMDPLRLALGTATSFSTQKPKVGYTPIGVPDGVPVPINTGSEKFKESSKPLPDVSRRGVSLIVEFDSVSYTTSGGSSKKDAQQEFATVSCVCKFAGDGDGYPASYFTWDGSGLQVKVPGSKVHKMTGAAPSIGGDPQDGLCTACCRDHHDSEGPSTMIPTTALYDPDRPVAPVAPVTDYTGNNHKHYNYNPSTLSLDEVDQIPGNHYLEACRFVRVDGFQRLLQDWRAVDMVVIPRDNYLSNTNTSALSKYQQYLVDYLIYQTRVVDCAAAPGASGCASTPNEPPKTDLVPRDLTGPPIENQLLARALYVDRVYSKTAPRTLDATYYSTLASKISTNATWLDLLPFNEVNVTLLANWVSSHTSVVEVTNAAITDELYSRGNTTILTGSVDSAKITAYLLPSNSGLTGGVKRAEVPAAVDYNDLLSPSGTIPYAGPIGIDRDDHRSANRKSDFLNIGRAP